jgi:hypothetical protein
VLVEVVMDPTPPLTCFPSGDSDGDDSKVQGLVLGPMGLDLGLVFFNFQKSIFGVGPLNQLTLSINFFVSVNDNRYYKSLIFGII